MADPKVQFKMLGYPEGIYLQLRDTASKTGTTNREVIRLAVENHMTTVLSHCAQAGFAPNEGHRKLVRTALDPKTTKDLKNNAKIAGLDSTVLLILCLRHELKMRLVDKEREDLVRRLKRRLAHKKKTTDSIETKEE